MRLVLLSFPPRGGLGFLRGALKGLNWPTKLISFAFQSSVLPTARASVFDLVESKDSHRLSTI